MLYSMYETNGVSILCKYALGCTNPFLCKDIFYKDSHASFVASPVAVSFLVDFLFSTANESLTFFTAVSLLLVVHIYLSSGSHFRHRKNRLQRQLQREENILLKEQVTHPPCRREMFDDIHHVHYLPKMHCTHAHGSLLNMTEVKPPGYPQDTTLKRDFATYGERRSSGIHPGDEMRTFRAPSIYDTTKNVQALDVLPPCITTRKSPNIYRCVHEQDDLIEVPEEEMVSLAADSMNHSPAERWYVGVHTQ